MRMVSQVSLQAVPFQDLALPSAQVPDQAAHASTHQIFSFLLALAADLQYQALADHTRHIQLDTSKVASASVE